jgi:hypothetical protein
MSSSFRIHSWTTTSLPPLVPALKINELSEREEQGFGIALCTASRSLLVQQQTEATAQRSTQTLLVTAESE